MFDTPQYSYRVFVTNMDAPIDTLVWFYNQRAGAENLIKEANNDAGLAAHPSQRWAMNCNHFQIAMLAYNLNCWLLLFNREENADAATLKHVRLSTRACAFCFWPPRSGVTEGGSGWLQRPLRGAGNLPAAAAAFAGDSRGRERIRAGGGGRAALLRSLGHKILCTASPDESTPYTRRMKFRRVASDRDQNTPRNGRVGPAHQACCSLRFRA